jgi:hypothetical protein
MVHAFLLGNAFGENCYGSNVLRVIVVVVDLLQYLFAGVEVDLLRHLSAVVVVVL